MIVKTGVASCHTKHESAELGQGPALVEFPRTTRNKFESDRLTRKTVYVSSKFVSWLTFSRYPRGLQAQARCSVHIQHSAREAAHVLEYPGHI